MRRREVAPVRRPHFLDDHDVAAALWLDVSAVGRIDDPALVADLEPRIITRMRASRLRALVASIEAGTQPPPGSLLPGGLDRLRAVLGEIR